MPLPRPMPESNDSATCAASMCACVPGDETRIDPLDSSWMRGGAGTDRIEALASSERPGQPRTGHDTSRFQTLLRELHSAYVNEMEMLESEVSSLRERLAEALRGNVLGGNVLDETVAVFHKTKEDPARTEEDLRPAEVVSEDKADGCRLAPDHQTTFVFQSDATETSDQKRMQSHSPRSSVDRKRIQSPLNSPRSSAEQKRIQSSQNSSRSSSFIFDPKSRSQKSHSSGETMDQKRRDASSRTSKFGFNSSLGSKISRTSVWIRDQMGNAGRASRLSSRSETDGERRARLRRDGLAFLTQDFDDDEREGGLRGLVESKQFEFLISFLIVLYALMLCIEAEYRGLHITINTPPEPLDGEFTFSVCHMVFGILFSIEMVLKLVVMRRRYFLDYWNWIDGTLVIIWLVSAVGVVAFPLAPSILRMARLGRIMRLLGLIKRVQGADTLFVMSTAIRHSVIVFFWTSILLSITLALCALLIHQYMCEFYFPKINVDPAVFDLLYSRFGTFTRAFFSMFELTLANGPPTIRMLAEHVSEWFFFFGVLHKLSIGFAIVGIINGVFMQEVFSVASMDDMLMLRRKERALKLHYRKVKALMGNASLSIEGWRRLVNDSQIKLWLASMEFDTADPDVVFHLIDDSNDGRIQLDELVKGMGRLKGSARAIDVAAILYELRSLNDYVKKTMPACD